MHIDIVARLALDPQLVLNFFACFSRFECALKRSGFVKKNKEEATPDWDTYSNGLPGSFSTEGDEAFLGAIAYLREFPPRRQIVEKGALGWKDTPKGDGEKEVAYVLRLVRVVRNNLFHGGKYRTGPVQDPARNHRLLEACMVVLERALTFSPDVARAFEEVL